MNGTTLLVNNAEVKSTNPLPVTMDSDVAIGAVELKDATTTTRATVTARGLQVEAAGAVASGAADSGNPVKAGGVYNETAPTLDTGDRGDLQLDVQGRLLTAAPSTRLFQSDLTLDTSAYADGDTLADILEVTNAVRVAGGTGHITSITVVDDDDQGVPFDILIFKQTFTLTGAKNAAWAVSDGDMANCIGIVRVYTSSYIDTGGNRVAQLNGLNLPITATGTSLYIGTISRGAGTYTAAGLRLTVGIIRD